MNLAQVIQIDPPIPSKMGNPQLASPRKTFVYVFREKRFVFGIFVVHENASESSFLNTENLLSFSSHFVKNACWEGGWGQKSKTEYKLVMRTSKNCCSHTCGGGGGSVEVRGSGGEIWMGGGPPGPGVGDQVVNPPSPSPLPGDPPPYYLKHLSIMPFSKTQKNYSCRVNPVPPNNPSESHTQKPPLFSSLKLRRSPLPPPHTPKLIQHI